MVVLTLWIIYVLYFLYLYKWVQRCLAIEYHFASPSPLTATSIPPLMATKNSPTLDLKIGG
jgi:hypothetical protein